MKIRIGIHVTLASMFAQTMLLLTLVFSTVAGANSEDASGANGRDIPFRPTKNVSVQGILDVESVQVPRGVRVSATDDLVIRSHGDITIDGELVAVRTRDASGRHNGPRIELRSEGRIVLRGSLKGSRGPDATSFGQDGGHGGDILLVALEILSASDLVAGDGGQGGPSPYPSVM